MDTSPADPSRTLQLSISKNVFNRIYSLAKPHLPPSMIGKRNCKYRVKTITEYLVMMCADRLSAEGISNVMMDRTDSKKTPTGACLLKRIGGSQYQVTRDCCDKVLDATLRDPRMANMLRNPVVTATDEHDIPAHFEKMDDEFMDTGKPKGGTSKMIRYTTVKVVKGAAGFTVAIHATGKKYDKASIVRRMLECTKKTGVTSKLHMLDRGYYTAKVLATLNEAGQPFIMPAVKNKKVARAIVSYHEKTGKAVLRHTVGGKNGTATVTLVIIKRKNAKETDPIVDQYLAFVTSADVHEANTRIATMPEEYKKRWGIETGYRGAKQVRPFTCSRNPSFRLVLFYFTMVLYNVWVMSNWIASGGRTDGGGDYVRPPITMYRLTKAFREACVQMIIGCVISEEFFAEAVK